MTRPEMSDQLIKERTRRLRDEARAARLAAAAREKGRKRARE